MIFIYFIEKIKSVIVFIIDLVCFEGFSWYWLDDGVGMIEVGFKWK